MIKVDTQTLIAVLVPSILSVFVTVANMVFNHVRDGKKSKDRAWDLAEKFVLSTDEAHLDGMDVADRIMYFQLVYRAALLVAESKEGELRRLFSDNPRLQSLVEEYRIGPP